MFTHLDQNNNPTMVDVTEKTNSIRMATAQGQIQLPEAMRPYFSGQDLVLKKGPVFQTAIIAATMAVKRTHELIPFCHQIPIEGCKVDISVDDNLLVTVNCRVRTTYKTGVEMEAMQGVSTAMLTIYDMCKAISHEMILKETKLLYKTGGKKTLLGRPTYGLILTGGKSERMGEAKALINYKGKAHAAYIHDVLSHFCDGVFLSARENQWKESELDNYPVIVDKMENAGPIGGILSAFEKEPEANWIVVACDLVHFNHKTVEKLLAHFNDKSVATVYKNRDGLFPEALCALYTPAAKDVFQDAFKSDVRCPVKVLKQTKIELIDQEEGINLANVNTPEERSHVIH